LKISYIYFKFAFAIINKSRRELGLLIGYYHINNLMIRFFAKLIKLFSKKNEPVIIPKEIHKIDINSIDGNALKTIRRLHKFKHQGFIVGGAVRDILTGKKPKDFDVATDATPHELKKLFRNAKIIGKRFKLVHLLFNNMIIEAATFRSGTSTGKYIKTTNNNIFGEIHEDVMRRDFTINSLYNPINEEIIDYAGGFNDILEKRLRTLINPDKSFKEDPVRMIRAIKYSIISGCKIDTSTETSIKKHAKEINKCSVSRLYDELIKIFKSGYTKEIISGLYEYGILKYILPGISESLNDKANKEFTDKALGIYSDSIRLNLTNNVDFFWCILLYPLINEIRYLEDNTEFIISIKTFIKTHLGILKIPNKSVFFISDVYFIFLKFKYSINKRILQRFTKSYFYPYSRLLKHFEDNSDYQYIEKMMIQSNSFKTEMPDNTKKKRIRPPQTVKNFKGKRCLETRKKTDFNDESQVFDNHTR